MIDELQGPIFICLLSEVIVVVWEPSSGYSFSKFWQHLEPHSNTKGIVHTGSEQGWKYRLGENSLKNIKDNWSTKLTCGSISGVYKGFGKDLVWLMGGS